MSHNPLVIIKNSFSVLIDFPEEVYEAVEEALTYDNLEAIQAIQQIKFQIGLAYRYRSFKRIDWLKKQLAHLSEQIKVCWLGSDGEFPTGHLELVKNVLAEVGADYDVEDLRENNAKTIKYKFQNKPPEPRYYQKEMVELAKEKHRGVFESAVGTGKSLVMQLLTKEFQVPTLIIVPSRDLAVQTADSFKHIFGSAAVELVSTGAKKGIQKPIRICTIQTLNALERKKELKGFLKEVGMICIDEVHHAGARSYTELLPFFDHIYYRFGFSGTFLRNDSRTLDMWGFLSTVLYRYSAAKAVSEGFLTPLKVVIHPIEGIKGRTYHDEYAKNYCENDELLTKIQEILTTYVHNNAQVLILVGRKEKSGGIIHKYLQQNGFNAEYVSGDSKKDYVKVALNNFNNKKTQILIGSSIIGEGIDIRSTDHLIMAQGGKSEIAVTQATGRAIRLFPGKDTAFLHDFKFLYTKYLEKHLARRLDIYKKNFDGEVYE